MPPNTCCVKSSRLNFGAQPAVSRYYSVLQPVRSAKSLLPELVFIIPDEDLQETFLDEKEAVMSLKSGQEFTPIAPIHVPVGALSLIEKELKEIETGEAKEAKAAEIPQTKSATSSQSGEGILDVARSVLSIGSKMFPSFSEGRIVKGALGFVGKAAKAATLGKTVATLATGPVGTTISNVLSEKFNKNPAWRPGFVGEAHLVLPTKSGLTRANFCGPGTNLQKRLPRGDEGVSQIDSACKIHDQLYNAARSKEDLRVADERLIRDIKKATDAGSVQKATLIAGIKAKTLGEDIGIFGPETFTEIPGLRGEGRQRGRGAITGYPLLQNPRQTPANFMASAPLDIRGITSGTYARSGLNAFKRFGSNGVMSPVPISTANLSRLSRRLRRGRIGNVKRSDPTISNLIGSGKKHSSNFKKGKRKQGMEGVQPPEEITLPGAVLKESVINLLAKQKRKKGKKERGRGKGGRLTQEKLAKLAASVVIPQIIKAQRKGKKGKGKKVKFSRKNKTDIQTKFGLSQSELQKVIQNFKKRGKKGQEGGIFGTLAGIAASIIIPEIVKAVRKKKKKKR